MSSSGAGDSPANRLFFGGLVDGADGASSCEVAAERGFRVSPGRRGRRTAVCDTFGGGLRLLAVVAAVAALALLAPELGHGMSRVEREIRRTFGPHAPLALRVARCESRLDPWAVGRAGERGLFQIHPYHFGRWVVWKELRRDRWHVVAAAYVNPARLFQVRFNVRVAWVMSHGGTRWTPWTCARSAA